MDGMIALEARFTSNRLLAAKILRELVNNLSSICIKLSSFEFTVSHYLFMGCNSRGIDPSRLPSIAAKKVSPQVYFCCIMLLIFSDLSGL